MTTSATHQITRSTRINSADNPVWMDGLRILLGLFLFLKGILFLQFSSDVFYIFSSGQEIFSAGKAHLLTSVVHIIGGLMIAFGFLTRLSLLCQFPVLLGAILIVNLRAGVNINNTELIMSGIVTAFLLFFMIVGPGRYSVDHLVLRPKHDQTTDNHPD